MTIPFLLSIGWWFFVLPFRQIYVLLSPFSLLSSSSYVSFVSLVAPFLRSSIGNILILFLQLIVLFPDKLSIKINFGSQVKDAANWSRRPCSLWNGDEINIWGTRICHISAGIVVVVLHPPRCDFLCGNYLHKLNSSCKLLQTERILFCWVDLVIPS